MIIHKHVLYFYLIKVAFETKFSNADVFSTVAYGLV